MKADTYLCPGCDKEVVVGTRTCPHCTPPRNPRKRAGKSAGLSRPGGRQERSADGIELPDEDFDYEDFVAREFGGKPHRQIGIKWYWWVTALVLVVVILW